MTIDVLFGAVPDWLMSSSGFGDSYGDGDGDGFSYGYGHGYGYGISYGSGYIDGSGKAPNDDD